SNLGCNPSSLPSCSNTSATVMDSACGTAQVTCAANPDSVSGCVYSRTLTFTAVSRFGSSATCTATYTWTMDTTRPNFTAPPADRDLGCNPSSIPGCDTSVAASDSCSVATI